jgi:hypothetical protein
MLAFVASYIPSSICMSQLLTTFVILFFAAACDLPFFLTILNECLCRSVARTATNSTSENSLPGQFYGPSLHG